MRKEDDLTCQVRTSNDRGSGSGNETRGRSLDDHFAIDSDSLKVRLDGGFERCCRDGDNRQSHSLNEGRYSTICVGRDGRPRHDGSGASLNEGARAGDDRGVADLGCLSERSFFIVFARQCDRRRDNDDLQP